MFGTIETRPQPTIVYSCPKTYCMVLICIYSSYILKSCNYDGFYVHS
uniref:Uncharacterized protein n=1 Tax=Anguilla anguilla TaxID=7936 RepID=A0A0E9UTY9_ANGAN